MHENGTNEREKKSIFAQRVDSVHALLHLDGHLINLNRVINDFYVIIKSVCAYHFENAVVDAFD